MTQRWGLTDGMIPTRNLKLRKAANPSFCIQRAAANTERVRILAGVTCFKKTPCFNLQNVFRRLWSLREEQVGKMYGKAGGIFLT